MNAKDYTKNLFREDLVRDVIEGLQGNLLSRDFDARKVPLEKILAGPNDKLDGYKIRIYSITEGPGKHIAVNPYGSSKRYRVPKGQVYATVDNIRFLCGVCATYKFKREKDKRLDIVGREVHVMA